MTLLTGRTLQEKRSAIVSSVIEGQVDVLISTMQLIGEGLDCPDLNTIVLTTPSTFVGRLLQVMGRIMCPGKDKQAMIYDYVDDSIPVLYRPALALQKMLEDCEAEQVFYEKTFCL